MLPQPGLFAQSADGTLKITVVQGQNEKNNIKLKLAVVPIIEVRDERDRLLSGVRCSFVLPNFGAGGKFSDGTSSMLVWTDASGRAAATGLIPTGEGKFNIRVTATYAGKEGSTTILMENTLADGPQKAPLAIDAKKKSNKLLWIVLAAGGAGAAGIFAATSGGGNKSSGPPPPTPTTITLGAVTVGGPR